jgi:hypothetical protein
MNKNSFKSIGSVFAGFVTVVILSVGTDLVLETSHIFPPQSDPKAYLTWMLVLALAYRSLYTVAGGYVTAKLAPDRPMRHAIILGFVGIAAGTLGVIVSWNFSPDHWYPISLVIGAMPCTWLGGKLKTNAVQRNISA